MKTLPAALRAFTLSLLCGLAACTQGRVNDYPSLANQGLLPLSTSNAYVGSNIFIASEAQRSPYLYNFLKQRGGPTAIEILQPQFGTARVMMFYPREREVYAADIMENENSRQWIIRGPYAIQRKDYRQLAALESSMNGEPLFFIRGKIERFRFRPEVEAPIHVIEPVVPVATPTPTPKKKVVKKITGSSEVISKKGNQPTEFRPLNSDQQAIQMSLGFAERAPNGDVIHTVRSDSETLRSIAKWYTGNEQNVAELVKLNSLGASDPLALGTRITIPLGLVRNFKSLGH